MNNGKITRLVLRAGMQAAAGIALVVAGPVLAVTTVDQTNYVTGSDSENGLRFADFYQTFTAGQSGSLAQIFLQISKASTTTTLSVDIYKARGSGSTTELYGDAIGTGTFVRDAFGLLTYNTNAFVLGGQYYGVLVKFISTCTGCDGRTPWAYNVGQYDGGNAGYINANFPNNSGDSSNLDWDFGFTTVVDRDVAPPSAVPEPATWGMMILGMGAIGFVMRRRRTITTRVSYVV